MPEKYRTPVVLCYFEGLTHDEAASRMGCPLGTVKGRLSRARELLRRRLTRRGLALSTAALAAQLAAPHAQAAVPAALELSTARAALALASSATASLAWGSSISIPVTALAEGVLHTMAWNQVRIAAGSLLLAGTLATGVVIGATQLGGGSGAGGTAQLDRQSAKGAAATPAAKSAASVSPGGKSQSAAINQLFDRMLSEPIDDSADTVERLSRWSSLMLSAELVVAANEGEEHAVRTAHRDRMKKLHDKIKALPPTAQNQTVSAEAAREKLDEAEGLLATEPSRPAAGMGMMQQMMQQQMRSMQRRPNRGGMMGGGMMGGGMMGMPPGGRRGVDVKAPAMGAGGGGSAGGQASESGGAGGAAGGMAAQPGAAGQAGVMGSGMAGGMAAMMDGKGGPGGARGSALSLAIVSAATEFAIRDKNPKSKMIHKALDEPISMSFLAETPLEDVLKYIKQATTSKTYGGIPIYVDPQGLEDVQGNLATGTIKGLELEGIPLKTTLRLMLKQLDLAYCVHDGLLFISSPRGVFEELKAAQQELDTAKEIEDESAENAAKAITHTHSRASHSIIVGPSDVPFASPRLVEGSSITKVEPCPGWDVTEIFPPCSRMIFCVTGNPSPVPREPLVEANNWKIDGMSASSIPDPVVADADTSQRRLGIPLGLDRDPRVMRALAGVDRIRHDVQDSPVNSLRVDHHSRKRRARLPVELDSELLCARLHQLDYVADRLVQVRELQVRLAVLREREHVHHEVVDLRLVLLDDRPAAPDDHLVFVVETQIDQRAAARGCPAICS